MYDRTVVYLPSEGDDVDKASLMPCACVTAFTSCTSMQFELSILFLIDDRAGTIKSFALEIYSYYISSSM